MGKDITPLPFTVQHADYSRRAAQVLDSPMVKESNLELQLLLTDELLSAQMEGCAVFALHSNLCLNFIAVTDFHLPAH